MSDAMRPLIRHIADLHTLAERIEILTGEVLSFTIASTTTPTQFVVDFEGLGTGTPGVLSCAGYAESTTPAPAVGDIVLAIRHHTDIIIMDRIS
ncbi:MAG: hypothetical protein ACYDHP_00560 [Ferrimicrobium sp.]